MAWQELASLQWRWPAAFGLLLLPLTLAVLARLRRRRLARYADDALLPWAVASLGPRRRAQAQRVADTLVWMLLAAAVAGPRLPVALAGADAPARPVHGIDVMVVLDVSASMAAQDLAPDRLTRAQLELQDLLRRSQGERLGLLIYGGQAGLLLPPTDDTALFMHALQQADGALLQAPGTSLARALTLAREQLARGEPARGRAVLLLSDAEEDSVQGEAQAAVDAAVDALRAADIPLFVLVTASKDGAPVLLADGQRAQRDGQPVLSRPALGALRRWALRTGGALSLAEDGDGDWQTLYDDGLARLPGGAAAPTQAQAWRELYGWPLGLAGLLLLCSALPPLPRRRAMAIAPLALLVAGLVSAPAPARAADGVDPAQAAAQAYRQQRWAEALAQFERQGGYGGHMGAGAAAWWLREFEGAEQHFRAALLLARNPSERDDALYNLGNALYARTQWQAAAQAWHAVLQSRPQDRRAAANLARAEHRLARTDRAPMKTDLRGRMGFAAEGLVSGDSSAPVREDALPATLPELGARDSGQREVAGARQTPTEAAAQQDAELAQEARLRESGQLKLERLQAQPRALQRGLLKQDREAAKSSDGVPW